MALTVKPVAASADKLVARAQAASGEYSVNAQAAGEKWLSITQAAKGALQAAGLSAQLADRWLRGVARAGAAKYSRKIKDVGADRFSSGVAAGKIDYAANVEPYFSTIAGLTLSARAPRGSPANYNRVQEVGKALNTKRLALLGVSGG